MVGTWRRPHLGKIGPWGARRPLALGIRGWGRDGGNSLRRIERLGETGPESAQFSNHGPGYSTSVRFMLCMHLLVQTEAERRRREAGVKQSMEIRLRSCKHVGWKEICHAFHIYMTGPKNIVARAFLFYKVARALKFLIRYRTLICSKDVARGRGKTPKWSRQKGG